MVTEVEFDDYLSSVKKYVMTSKFGTKAFSLYNKDIQFSIEIEKSIGGSVVAGFAVFNDDVSRIASELYGRNVDYRLVSTLLSRVAENGKIVGYSLMDLSEYSRSEFFEAIRVQSKQEFDQNRSLDMIFERVNGVLCAGSPRPSDIPGICFRLSMVAFVIGRDWRCFINRALDSKSEIFNETARRLGSILDGIQKKA